MTPEFGSCSAVFPPQSQVVIFQCPGCFARCRRRRVRLGLRPVRFGLHESAFSRCHFMSPSRDRRMTETATRAGSRGGSLPQPRPSICSCAVQAWDRACVRLETVRPAGAVPPAIACMIFGERNANGGRYHDRAAGHRRIRQDDTWAFLKQTTIGMHRHVKSPGAWSFIDEPTIAVKLQINLRPPVRKNFLVERLA